MDGTTNGDVDNEESIEEFDRNLPATHSYLPGGLSSIRGRSVLEAGWQGTVPCWCHQSIVFPGESLPMHYPHTQHNRVGIEFILTGRLFGLICPERMLGSSTKMSNYGVLCEVVEASQSTEGQISFKAQARQRFCLMNNVNWDVLLQQNMYISNCDIKILPDIILQDPLQECRLFSSVNRNPDSCLKKKLLKSDSMLTPWPHFVYNVFDVQRITKSIKLYFKKLSHENLPEDLLSLSYWVASNLTMPIEERFQMFKVDNALLRLYIEFKYITKSQMLCCSTCNTQICTSNEAFAMSNEGFYSNYCNVGGYVHDILTVKEASNIELKGRPSLEFTWFPGYYWTIGCCTRCYSHIGWKFTAGKLSLRPQSFYGLTRNSITTIRIHTI